MNTQRRRRSVAGVLATAVVLAILVPAAVSEEPDRDVKEFKVLARNWSFSPDRIQVEQGTKVVIHVESHDAPHSFVLKAFGVKVTLPQDKTKDVVFVADKPGTFRWYCGRPCGNGCPKMTGELTVVPARTEAQPEDAQGPTGS